MRLPPELRLMVYRYVLDVIVIPINKFLLPARDEETKNNFSLLYVCKLIFREASSVLEEHSTLKLLIDTNSSMAVRAPGLSEHDVLFDEYGATFDPSGIMLVNNREPYLLCDRCKLLALPMVKRYRHYCFEIIISCYFPSFIDCFLFWLGHSLTHDRQVAASLEIFIDFRVITMVGYVGDNDMGFWRSAGEVLGALTYHAKGIPKTTVRCKNLPPGPVPPANLENVITYAQAYCRQVPPRDHDLFGWLETEGMTRKAISQLFDDEPDIATTSKD